jgi:hypothetical protein
MAECADIEVFGNVNTRTHDFAWNTLSLESASYEHSLLVSEEDKTSWHGEKSLGNKELEIRAVASGERNKNSLVSSLSHACRSEIMCAACNENCVIIMFMTAEVLDTGRRERAVFLEPYLLNANASFVVSTFLKIAFGVRVKV